ncbi:MAG TPA: TIGR00282 family metallophosphoesterase [Acidobacteriota bacterium]|nr:TIGR00282 family metallophosphoesterase [Acidobacteriota bacterium]
MNVLMIGDIVAKPGRKVIEMNLPSLIEKYDLDFISANAENVAHGFGVTPETADELLRIGIDVLTSGNHIWDKKEIIEYMKGDSRLLRPANYSKSVPGRGHIVARSRKGLKVGVVNLQGRVFMGPSEDPFAIGQEVVNQIRKETPIILVDMHGEASSEKQAMGWFLDGKVSAVCGSHTHVPTADQRVLPGGTAYVTDIGMTGPYDSIIGVDKEQIIQKFLDQMPTRFEPAKEDPMLQAMLIQIDEQTGHAQTIQRITVRGDD